MDEIGKAVVERFPTVATLYEFLDENCPQATYLLGIALVNEFAAHATEAACSGDIEAVIVWGHRIKAIREELIHMEME